MSRSEPCLPVGDGLLGVCASGGPQSVSKSGSVSESSSNYLASSSGTNPPDNLGNRSVERRELGKHSSLPPLFSLNDIAYDAPPWLFSAALHMLAVILLGLVFFAPEVPEELLLQFDYRDNSQEDLSGTDVEVPLDLSQPDFKSALAPEEIPTLENSLASSAPEIRSPLHPNPLPTDASPIRMALTGREPGMQQALLDAYGGTAGTQHAVLEALRWLARNQGKKGLWSMTGKYTDGVRVENHEAATALALIAFQGAGYTPHGDSKEPFTKIVSRAWRSLLEQQDENGNFFHTGRGHGQLYTQAICTIAICELYGMTQNEQYRKPAQQAIDYCVRIQSPEGGWRYFPGSGSDLSVTGWFVMALQSARMAGLSVPSPTLDQISEFLNSLSRQSGSQYSYQPNTAATLSMSAEGLLCRQYLGWSHSDSRLQRGADLLLENLPSWESGDRDAYYWYYATQVCHHMENRHWRTWNQTMRTVLPDNQVRKGRERGSWDPQGDRWGNAGGRLFVTCLSTYMLEVYYRHLPIYQLDLLEGRL